MNSFSRDSRRTTSACGTRPAPACLTTSTSFLRFNDRRVLPDTGKVSREAADEKALGEYERFAQRRRAAIEAQAEADALRELEDASKKLPKRRKPKGS